MTNGHGGRRSGSGRKRGSPVKRTPKTTILAEKQAGEGILPLAVLLECMRSHYAAGQLDAAASVARDAAPYLHVKCPTTLNVNRTEVIRQVSYVVLDATRAPAHDAPAPCSGELPPVAGSV